MLSEGDKLGAFEITSLLGKGGMGEVYRARDTKLGREVAIKVLPEDFAQDKDRLKRFGREAKLLASLDHPNVGAIHEFQEADGVHFLVMQLVEGETLSERIRKGPLPLREALPIFVQIARGLDAAHESGIVHRDLKPANVKIAPNGDVKVLDFGIAKKTVVTKVDPDATTTPMTSFPLTDEGTILGTPLYMSPEQARGKTVDSRTDIWAFGCCLYEALTGSTPFPGETMTDIFAAILERDPDWGALPDSVPREVRRLLRHCLEKNPRERLRDIADAQYELEEWERERAVAPDQGVPTAPPRSRMATVLFAGAGLLLAVLFMFAVTLFNRDRADEFAEQRSVREPIRSLVVLPFTNLMGDPEQEYFVDGMTDALSAELGKIRALKVISRTSAMRYKGTDKPLPRIAEELGVEGIVEGSIFRSGNEVRITAQLIHGATDSHLWAENYVGTLENILALQSEVALAIAEAIRITVTPEEETRIATKKPVDPEAYEAYLRGTFFFWKFTPDSLDKAVESFQRAVELDPGFAQAHAWLGAAYWVSSVWGFVPPSQAIARARSAIDRALALDDTLATAHAVAGWIALMFDWDWSRAERELLRAIELDPGDPLGHQGLSQTYERLGRFDDALRKIQVAIDLDPLNLIYMDGLANVYVSAGRYEEAIAQRQKVLELEPALLPALRNASIEYRLVSRHDDAVEVMERAIDIQGRLPRSLAYLLVAQAAAGRKAEAEALLAELQARAPDEYVGAVSFALAYAALGDMDEAFRWLDRAVEDRENPIGNPYWPVWFPFRGDPRFLDMLRKINYPNITAFEAKFQSAAATNADRSIEKIAVLPFTNISSDPEQEYFVDGMTEALISKLAKISALRVISRTSAMRYKGTDKPLPQIANELGVEAIVEGSVFRAGNEVRITAQLIHGATDSHLWAESYMGTLENILKLQGEVALAIAEAIRITVTPEEETRIATKKPVDPEAYEAYLRGRFFFWKFTPDSLAKAVESFQRAIELDPGYAEAHSWLGAAHWAPSVFGFVPPAPAVARARPLIDKALALDDTFAFAHIIAGHIALTFDWDWARAEREFLRAIELSPGNPDGHLGLSQFYASVGRFDDAIRILPTAINLDPFNFLYSSSLADQYLLAGRYEEAIAQRRKVLELEPAYLPALRNAPIDYRRLNRYDEAVEVIEGGIAIHGRLPVLVEHLVWAYAAAGRKVEAEVVLAELHAIDRDQYVAATTFVFAYAALGDMDEAFRWMDQAIEDHDYWLPFPYWPSWDLLRGDPRFIDMLRRINYPAIAEFEAAMETANAR